MLYLYRYLSSQLDVSDIHDIAFLLRRRDTSTGGCSGCVLCAHDADLLHGMFFTNIDHIEEGLLTPAIAPSFKELERNLLPASSDGAPH